MNDSTRGCPTNVAAGTAYKLAKKKNNGIVYGIYWDLGFVMAHVFKFLRFSPNFVSFLSLVFYVIMGYLFLNSFFVWGGICFFLGILMDCTDGKLARMTNNTSRLGVWLDYNFDNVRPLFLYPPIGIALFGSTGDIRFVLLAFVAVVATLVFVIVSMVWDGFDFAKSVKEKHVGKSKWHPILKQFYFYEGIEPLAVILLAALSLINWYLIIWAFGMTAMYLLMAFYGGFVINRKDKNEN
ncbi:CDP-alcohol phosphatidyltransferase family protein [Candidatus Peregrinibacteria bacterium]|jgi:phosphatidylglycerophosphate synthase|nr:CDP-alcohol phosphatidyltransferase family protein [Candidatus Peregrinibacteria bacterium]